jgi:hypothetical protein
MRLWKVFLPTHEELESLARIVPGELYVSSENAPIQGSIYVRNKDGEWLSLSWDYVDVQFKFEIYRAAIERLGAPASGVTTSVGAIPDFVSMGFLLRSEWVRPSLPGEVPAEYVPVVEEHGPSLSVSATATAVGTVLHGIVFEGPFGKPLLTITVDDIESYSMKVTTEPSVMKLIVKKCDQLSLQEVLVWTPPG